MDAILFNMHAMLRKLDLVICLAIDYSISFSVAAIILLSLRNLVCALQVRPFKDPMENTKLVLGEFAFAVSTLLLPFII